MGGAAGRAGVRGGCGPSPGAAGWLSPGPALAPGEGLGAHPRGRGASGAGARGEGRPRCAPGAATGARGGGVCPSRSAEPGGVPGASPPLSAG